MPTRAVFYALIKRERLGGSGIGGGMAILHKVCFELTQRVVITIKLETAIAFDAHDKKSVDNVCKILGLDQANCDHLKLLSAAAKHLEKGVVYQALRSAKTASDIRQSFDRNHATAA